jgi:hypothetical protein
MRIVTLLARHGTIRYPAALRDIRNLFAQQIPEAAHETVVIDNGLPRDHNERIATGITLIGGDNSAWEFSAWDCGIQSLGAQLDSYDFIHLATSAFRQLYIRYLDRFDADMLGLVRGRAAATGHVDFFNEPVTLFGRTVQAWLRSSFVFLPPAELRLLGSLVSVTDRRALFSGDPTAPFRADAPLSPANRSNILGWLTGSGTGQGVEWHSKIALSDATLGFFEDKPRAAASSMRPGWQPAPRRPTWTPGRWVRCRTGGSRWRRATSMPRPPPCFPEHRRVSVCLPSGDALLWCLVRTIGDGLTPNPIGQAVGGGSRPGVNATVAQIIDEVSPFFHSSGSLYPDVLWKIVEEHHAANACISAETGCGLSTLICRI